MPDNTLDPRLEALYQRWHRIDYLSSDPLDLVVRLDRVDQEVGALVVSCLALGRASLAKVAASQVLERIGFPLGRSLISRSYEGWLERFAGFRYRFFGPTQLAGLAAGLGSVLREFGSLEAGFAASSNEGWSGLESFSQMFWSYGHDLGILLPKPGTTGGFKRLNLFLRWMVRNDDLDLGLWSILSPRQLFMPVDTHVLQWAQSEGLTARKSADRQACWEITSALREVCPGDPLRYDFAITRAGMETKGTLS